MALSPPGHPRSCSPGAPGAGSRDIALPKTLQGSSLRWLHQPRLEVHPQHRCPQTQPRRVGGTVGTRLLGIPSPSPGREALPATLGSAAEPGLRIGF